MSIKFNPFTGQLDLAGAGGSGSPFFKDAVATETDLGLLVGSIDGETRAVLATHKLYVFDSGSNKWIDTGITLAPFGTTPNADGLTLTTVVAGPVIYRTLNMEPADSTNPGGISTGNQVIPGSKTFPAILLADGGIDVTPTGGTDTLSIGISNADIINIGRSGVTINMIGDTIYENVTNLNVSDKLITINVGGGVGSASDSGVEIEENAVITGFLKTNPTRDAFRFKAPASSGEFLLQPNNSGFNNTFTSSALTASRSYNLINASGNIILDTATQTLTNKTFDADLNTLTNVEDADIKAGANIALAKLAALTANRALQSDGSGVISASAVTNTELGYLSGVTSPIQTQFTNKANVALDNLSSVAINTALLPATDFTTNIGSNSARWNAFFLATANVRDASGNGIVINNSNTSPSGTVSGAVRSDGTTDLTLYTISSGAVNATPTATLRIETGNKTAGTGNSGDINLLTGTSSGGSRGSINVSGLNINLNAANQISANSVKIVNLADPTLNQDAATKFYVDNSVSTNAATRTLNNLTTTNINASLLFDTDVAYDIGASTKSVKDLFALNIRPSTGHTLTIHGTSTTTGGIVAFDASRIDLSNAGSPIQITGVNTPSVGTDAANKNYVDAHSTASSAGDIAETSFNMANNQAAPANVTGFAFANATVRAFQALVSVFVDATSDFYETFTIQGIQKGASWDITSQSTGDNSSVVFSITSGGQVQYTTPNYTGFGTGTMKFRAITTSV